MMNKGFEAQFRCDFVVLESYFDRSSLSNQLN